MDLAVGAQHQPALLWIENHSFRAQLGTQQVVVSNIRLNPGPFRCFRSATGVSGVAAPTGTVTFKLFGPNNATCTGTPDL